MNLGTLGCQREREEMRRRAKDEDSLELLLDTICNVFGSIVFIAILVAILSSSSSTEPDETSVYVSPAEIAASEARIAELENDIEQLEQNEAALFDEEEVEALILLDHLEDQERRAELRRAELDQWLQQFDEDAQKELDAVASERDAEESRIVKLREQLEAIDGEHMQVEARLPMQQRTNRHQIICILDNDQFYWLASGVVAAQIGDRLPNDDVQETSLSTIPARSRLTVRPGGGERVIENVSDMRRIGVMFEHLDSDRYFFNFAVRPDEVANFQRLRDAVLERGFRYQVFPLDAEQPLTLTKTTEPLFTQ
ncbi:MAG: hypothetical protein WD294_15075 [Phycisphaeraceae bacterium]